jgi:hypothetical protein
MNELERKTRQLISTLTTRLSQWWGNSAKPTGRKRIESAAARARDLRDTETAKKAASALHDLREHETTKKAGAKLNDLRGSDTAKKAEAKLNDLRQREPVKKAEENARKVMHDLFSGGRGSTQA